MASNIGIKVANGEFYPLMEENSSIKKKIILTTAHDNQPSVQIDLYRSAESVMSDAQYIGSLVIENIQPRPKKEPSIEMVISSNSEGEIVADAIDLDTGPDAEHHVLTVCLKSLDETTRDMEIPDFELEPNEEPPSGLYQHAQKIREKKQRFPLWLIILISLLVILGLLAAWWMLRGRSDSTDTVQTVQREVAREPDPVIPPPVIEPEPVRQPEPVQQTEAPEPVPVIQAPVEPPQPRPQTTGRRPPVASYNVPAVIPREGINYTIRWGDTLWDIADAFYREPWLYPRIAQHNNIRNPNYIISGRTIRIPPKN